MSFDIYGQRLRAGHCEVHPDVHEPYPCFVCLEGSRRNQEERKHHADMEREYYAELERQYEAEMRRADALDAAVTAIERFTEKP